MHLNVCTIFTLHPSACEVTECANDFVHIALGRLVCFLGVQGAFALPQLSDLIVVSSGPETAVSPPPDAPPVDAVPPPKPSTEDLVVPK